MKVRLAGDAVFAPDRWMRKMLYVTLGSAMRSARWTSTAFPGRRAREQAMTVDLYLSGHQALLRGARGLQRGRRVQLCGEPAPINSCSLLGFGGDGSGYKYMPEASVSVLLSDDVMLGAEYRDKPSNLRAFGESGAEDVFLRLVAGQEPVIDRGLGGSPGASPERMRSAACICRSGWDTSGAVRDRSD